MKRTATAIGLIILLLSVWCVLAIGVTIDFSGQLLVQDISDDTHVANTSVETQVETLTSTPPTSYNDDYRNLQYITSVKNQNPLGMCWTFAACAAAESDAIKNHGAAPDVDLSEWHLGYFAYNAERDGTGDSVEYAYSGAPYYDVGGSSVMAAHTLAAGIGFASESIADYDDLVYAAENGGDTTLDPSLRYQCEYYIDNVYYYDLPTQADDVKNAILTYGAVATSYYSSTSSSYFNSANSAFYCNNNYNETHAVTIVGWDDDYPKTNFSTTPSNNGAWLIKNSWGTGWGLGGYFWISYEDKTMTSATAYDVVDTTEYDNRYQHDGGIITAYAPSSGNIYYGNVFQSVGEETLTAVSIETCQANNTKREDCSGKPYTLEIYKGTNNSSELSKGTLEHTQSGAFGQVGMSTIKLTKEVQLKTDEKFFVCFRTTAYVGIDRGGALQAYSGSNLITIVNSNVAVNAGESYISGGGTTWYDCNSYFTTKEGDIVPANIRIKAYTVDTNVGTPTVATAPTLSTINYGQKISVATINGGEVKDSLRGKTIEGEWSFENPDAIYVNGDKVNLVFTPYKSAYSPINVEVSAVVETSYPKITIEAPYLSVYAGQEVEIVARVTNPYDETLAYDGVIKYSYRVGLLGDWVSLSDNTFTVPDSAVYGSHICVKVETESVEGKYASTEELTSWTVRVACQVQSSPTASALKYGQKWEETTLSGGVVVDKYRGTPLSGTWSVVVDGYYYATSTENHRVKFVPDNTNYSAIEDVITIEVVATEINIAITKNEEEWEVGKIASLSVKLTNPNYDLFSVETSTAIYYSVDGGDYVSIDGTSFVVPQNANCKKIKIKVVANAVPNKYVESTKEEEFQVETSVPTTPATPEEPVAPEDPSEPDEPTIPDEPDEPDEPTEPDQPSDPDEPTEPEQPITPQDPTTPDEPSQDEPTKPKDDKEGGSYNDGGVLDRLGDMIGIEGLDKAIPFIVVTIIVVAIIVVAVKKIKNR